MPSSRACLKCQRLPEDRNGLLPLSIDPGRGAVAEFGRLIPKVPHGLVEGEILRPETEEGEQHHPILDDPRGSG
jgi:hypothetical protein